MLNETLEILIPLIALTTSLMTVYFYLGIYRHVKGHLSRTVKLGGLIWRPVLLLVTAELLIMLAFTIEFNEVLHESLELAAVVMAFSSSISLNIRFRGVKSQPLLLRLYLEDDIQDYNLITIVTEGSIPTYPIIQEMAQQVSQNGQVILLLGPQYDPMQEYGFETINVGIPTHPRGGGEHVLNQYSPTELTIKLSELIDKNGGGKEIFLVGDFLDNLMEALPEEDFFKVWILITSKLKYERVNGIFLVQRDMHNPRLTRLVERYSNVSLELREVEKGNRILTYMRVSNNRDDIRTNWFKI